MAANFGFSLVFIAIIVASMQCHGTMAQTTHIVGDASGWTILNGGTAAYTTWASQKTFIVGDTLLFNFTNGQHDVAVLQRFQQRPTAHALPLIPSPSPPLAPRPLL
ncbi:putative Phytocyanin domain, cupredoxin [Helianthus anomalus]